MTRCITFAAPARTSKTLSACLAFVAATGLVGCGKDDVPRLGDFLDELQVEGPRENATYVSLGTYHVAMQAKSEEAPSADDKPIWVRVSFKLFAETSPGAAPELRASVKEAKSDVRDGVITAVRSSTAEDLADPRWASLKARMSEAARRQVGENQFRQLVCPNIVVEKI